MRRNDIASTSFRHHVPTRFLISQCQIITFLILKSDNIENSRIELKGILLPVPSNQIKVTFIIILPFNLVHLWFFPVSRRNWREMWVDYLWGGGGGGGGAGGGRGAKGYVGPPLKLLEGGWPLCPPPAPPPPPSSYAYDDPCSFFWTCMPLKALFRILILWENGQVCKSYHERVWKMRLENLWLARIERYFVRRFIVSDASFTRQSYSRYSFCDTRMDF